MSKINGSWSGMRKYLEEDMLCDALKGRIRYNCTKHKGMDGTGLFEIYIDGDLIKMFNMFHMSSKLFEDKDFDWDDFWTEFDKPMNERAEFTDSELAAALENYCNSDIAASLASENPIVRMFAILDRRVGKRTLENLKETINEQPEWLQFFYRLRIEV